MFSLRDTLKRRQVPLPYNVDMGIVVLCGRRPTSITNLRSSPTPEWVFIHFKSLIPLNNNVNQFIDIQFIAMQRLFAEGGIAVFRGTTEDLSGDPALQTLQNLDVGDCAGSPTSEQNTLFANRNNVGNNEIVVYIVSSLTGGAGNFVGCATHPDRQPGAAVVVNNARWLVAHEVGHVLGLRHVCGDTPAVPCVAGHADNLMFPNVGWTNVPPDISASEYRTMAVSDVTHSMG